VPTPTAPADRPPGLEWDFTRDGIARGAWALGVFAALYAALVSLGLKLHENTEALTIMWPAAGLLFMALWLSPGRNWIWILGVQLTIELSASAIQSEHFSFVTYIPFAAANSIDGMVGAFVASRLIETPRVPRMRNVLVFIAAVAVGAAAPARVGAVGNTRTQGGAA
jgi:integral membrane sensor domain MASE1